MKKLALVALLSIVISALSPVAALAAPQAPLAADLDALLSAVYKANEPGAAFLIWKDGKVLVRKAYGLADLELGVRMEPDMIFRIGSMTKQFTATAILMLMERGQLALSDPITKFLPDYPTQARTITVEHLLTHTSGIKSYTDLEEFGPLARKDMTVPELIAVFKDKPMEFAPGERWKYNNSGFFLLGAIIEKISGSTYEAFLQKNIFDPLGLTHTHYGNATRLIPRRIPGYGPGPDNGFSNAEFLSMALPFSAGSLLSNVDDLAVWNAALLAGKVLKPETLAKAWTSYKLADGTLTGYGYGWSVGEYEGHRMIRHGGGIPGFTTDGILFPDDKLFVTLLTNSTVSKRTPDSFNFRAAALALGKPYKNPTAVSVPEKDLALLAGVYANAQKEEYAVRVAGGKITVSGPGIAGGEVFPLSPNLFFIKDSLNRFEFTRNAKGEAVEFLFKPGFGSPMRFARTAKPLPPDRKIMALDPKVFDQYIGEYELSPGFTIKFFRDGAKFMTQATGQSAVEIFAESEAIFFLKVIDAQVEFVKDADGKVTGIVLNQGGRRMPGKKIK
jgi:CubicO group peptidase (beta-lactamase class C family)